MASVLCTVLVAQLRSCTRNASRTLHRVRRTQNIVGHFNELQSLPTLLHATVADSQLRAQTERLAQPLRRLTLNSSEDDGVFFAAMVYAYPDGRRYASDSKGKFNA